jgi:hypothetical protein
MLVENDKWKKVGIFCFFVEVKKVFGSVKGLVNNPFHFSAYNNNNFYKIPWELNVLIHSENARNKEFLLHPNI